MTVLAARFVFLGLRQCFYRTGCQFRLGESASQTGVDENLAHYAKVTAAYIRRLEAKVRAFEEASEEMGECPLTQYLAEEVTREVEENDVPTPPDSRGQHPAWEWTQDEAEEWEKWQHEKAVQAAWDKEWADDDAQEQWGEEWEHDAQPPSEHLMAAAAASSPAVRPANALPNAPCATPAKMNSTTHRAEYMKLVS